MTNSAPLLARAAQALRAGRPSEAIEPLREAARLDSQNPNILHDLGVACLDTGRAAEAVVALQRAVALNPRFARAHLRLGMAYEAQGHTAALDAYLAAARALPSLTEAQFRAGNLLELAGRRDEALACFRRAATNPAKSSLSRIAGARALLIENRDAEAERTLRQAMALDPANAVALEMLGTVLADAGRFDEARDCYARAIAAAPLLAGSYYDLVRCRPVRPDERDVMDGMQAALDQPGLDTVSRVRLHLALGKAADDLGQHERAMRHFDAADAERRKLVAFDAAAFDAQADRIIARTTPDLLARAAEQGRDDPMPVLVLGLPRSGTTLVEHILSSHPAVAAGGELGFWIERGAQSERLDELDAAFLGEAAADYLRRLRGIGPKALRVTDKMPLNFVWAGLIHMALPQATIVHCRRDPLDTALSIHQTFFNPRLALPTGGAELVAYVRTYRRLMDHWRRVLPTERYVEIEYETLTAAPEAETRRLIAACGLAWNAACLRPEDNARVIRTPSKWQARQKVHRGAVGRWRRFADWLGPLAALRPTDMTRG